MARQARYRNGHDHVTFAADHRPSPEALAGLIDYMIPEARQINETVAFLLTLARHELSEQLAGGAASSGADGARGKSS
jgi:hypothetical protein